MQYTGLSMAMPEVANPPLDCITTNGTLMLMLSSPSMSRLR